MAITDTITLSMFRDYFARSDQYNNVFSYHGLTYLYNYLWELSEDTGKDIEMDYISFCCDYAEYENLEQFQNDYGEKYKTIEDIEEETTVIRMGKGSFIVQQF